MWPNFISRWVVLWGQWNHWIMIEKCCRLADDIECKLYNAMLALSSPVWLIYFVYMFHMVEPRIKGLASFAHCGASRQYWSSSCGPIGKTSNIQSPFFFQRDMNARNSPISFLFRRRASLQRTLMFVRLLSSCLLTCDGWSGATHFELGSRACGALLFGCSSLCVIQDLPCAPSYISFSQSSIKMKYNPSSNRVGLELSLSVSSVFLLTIIRQESFS